MQAQVLDKELEREVEAIGVFVKSVLKKNNLSLEKFIDILKEKENGTKINVPCCIFRKRNLGILESLAIYLKDEFNLNYHEIALLLNRDDRIIWASYNNARKKFKGSFVFKNNLKNIPISVFANRDVGLLEALTIYLKENESMRNHEIAEILNRDERTIWTSYKRANEKLMKIR
ncbi:MAG: hypothetical protein PHV16_01855 [Candidatus Nanoarchaeia archaeon]|nr:hypothetical protein [Candidatus Nanoarchaeia archaeon]